MKIGWRWNNEAFNKLTVSSSLFSPNLRFLHPPPPSDSLPWISNISFNVRLFIFAYFWSSSSINFRRFCNELKGGGGGKKRQNFLSLFAGSRKSDSYNKLFSLRKVYHFDFRFFFFFFNLEISWRRQGRKTFVLLVFFIKTRIIN